MRKLMAIFAHPDDEEVMGGTMASYVRQGVEVMLICSTRGEAGEIANGVTATPENLGEVRQRELEEAVGLLGVQQLRFLDYRDSGMAGTPENGDPRSLSQAKPEKVVGDIVGLIREFKPDIFVTFEPFGWYGHPDHVLTGKYGTEAFYQAANAGLFPHQGPAWQTPRLYHSVFLFTRYREVALAAKAAGLIKDEEFFRDEPRPEQIAIEKEITHQLDVREFVALKEQALYSHRTQFSPDSNWRKIPREMLTNVNGFEQFIQVYPKPNPTLRTNWATDLFS